MIAIDKLTLGEVAAIEKLSHSSISALGDDEAPKGLVLAAIYYVNKRREDPTYTWNQANEVEMGTAMEFLGFNMDDEDADSDVPAAEGGADDEDPTQTD